MEVRHLKANSCPSKHTLHKGGNGNSREKKSNATGKCRPSYSSFYRRALKGATTVVKRKPLFANSHLGGRDPISILGTRTKGLARGRRHALARLGDNRSGVPKTPPRCREHKDLNQ